MRDSPELDDEHRRHDFERDGVKYQFYSNLQVVEPYDFLATEEENVWRQNYTRNHMTILTQAILAKVAYTFEDKPAQSTSARLLLPDYVAVFTREDDSQAGPLLYAAHELHRDLSRDAHPDPEAKVIFAEEDAFLLTPDQAKLILIQAAETIGYELPEDYKRSTDAS